VKAGWQKETVGAICNVVNGGTPKTNIVEYWDGAHQWITPAEMGKRSTPYVSETERTLTDIGLANSSAHLLPPYSVILSSRAPIGHLVINTEPMATNQGCKGLVPGKNVDHKFLYYYLGSIVDLLDRLGIGTTFKELSGARLKEVPVPIPPLHEQARIVGILDEAFEGIATAKDNAEKNLRNARATFESYLNVVFSQRGNGWVEKPLKEVCLLQRGFDLPTRLRKSGDFPLVSSSGVIDSHNIGPVKGPGVATGRSGSIGKVFYIEEDYWPLNTVLYVKQFYRNNPKFIYRLLSIFDLKRFATGTGVPTLNRNFVHDERIFVPQSEVIQEEISEKIDKIEQETQRLESLYRQKLTALEELKKSLLHQAFTGQL